MTSPLFRIRNGVPGDSAWVFDSWVRSFESTRLAGSMRHIVYAAGQRALILELLQRKTAWLRVACAPDDDNTILGWALVEYDGTHKEPRIIHYVHVKAHFRNIKIATVLLDVVPDMLGVYTHKTLDSERYFRRHEWTYNPYFAWTRGS